MWRYRRHADESYRGRHLSTSYVLIATRALHGPSAVRQASARCSSPRPSSDVILDVGGKAAARPADVCNAISAAHKNGKRTVRPQGRPRFLWSLTTVISS